MCGRGEPNPGADVAAASLSAPTRQVGRAYFETATKSYQILDAPGHKNFVPNMIGGCQVSRHVACSVAQRCNQNVAQRVRRAA
jgi:sulfate adenylyltransferase subunit 1 (EFTu-like GTPase family)